MYPSRIDLDPRSRQRMIEVLNGLLASAIDLRAQAKLAHWNVKGPQFDALHGLFEKVAQGVDHFADLVAERAVQLGGLARGTVQQVTAATDLEEYSAEGGTDAHVTALADALAAFGSIARKAIDDASEAGDHVTEDILTEVARGIDKSLWLVEVHLQTGEAPEVRQAERGDADDGERPQAQ
jgi:starvation-inducible DNA-binding protein